MILGIAAGLIAFVALVVYGVLPLAASRGDWRLIDVACKPVDLADLDSAFASHLGNARREMEPAGLVFAGVVRALQDQSANGRITRTYFLFRDPDGTLIAWRYAMQAVRADGRTMPPIAQQAVILSALQGRFLVSSAGFGPDVSPTEKIVSLWHRGGDFAETLKRHRAWIGQSGAPAVPIPEGAEAEAAIGLLRFQIGEGLANGSHVADAEKRKYRLSYLACLKIVYWSLPPGRWFWRNPVR